MSTASANEFEGFLRELRPLLHRLHSMGSLLHGGDNIPESWRSLLAGLDQGGEQTIPQLARLRSVSRQQIQVEVRALEKAGLVETRPNPAHRTSHLLALTKEGRGRLSALREKEETALGRLGLLFEPGEIGRVAKGLHQIRTALDKVQAGLTSPQSCGREKN
ncbi:MAG: MarR family transcriptional regulator [Humidesulfovibrio sp.]|nr:MarR family transcriptional regulator [Humidesulfovibrio sp.]